MVQKLHFSNAHPIEERFKRCQNVVGFFLKSQLLMCWMVAISCIAYEVDGIGTVLFLIALGTESSISLQPGGENLVLEQKLYKQAVRNLTMFS